MSFQESEHIILKELETMMDKVNPKEIDQAISLIKKSDKIFFNALGRAAFAGKSFVMRLMHMGREVYVVGETNTPNFGENDLLIICSGSGETAQFIQIAEKAKSLGGNVLVMTATPRSTLTKIATASIILPAPSKKQEDSSFKSVQPMASLYEQGILIAGDAIILTMMKQETSGPEMFKKHSNLE